MPGRIFYGCDCVIAYLIIFLLLALSGCTSNKVSTNNEIAGPFKTYDRTFEESIEQRWDTLLEKSKKIGHKSGKVALQFRLNYDGSITDMKVTEDNVGGEQLAICKEAVLSSVPLPQWPPDMRRMVGLPYREVTFTFNYR